MAQVCHVRDVHPFFLFYLHHLGFFPRCHPPEWDSVWGRFFFPGRSSDIGCHRASEFGLAKGLSGIAPSFTSYRTSLCYGDGVLRQVERKTAFRRQDPE